LASRRGYAVFLLPEEPIFQIDASFMNQTSASKEISKLRSVFTTDARSRFGAEVISTDAS
jgi:hypothetical protein